MRRSRSPVRIFRSTAAGQPPSRKDSPRRSRALQWSQGNRQREREATRATCRDGRLSSSLTITARPRRNLCDLCGESFPRKPKSLSWRAPAFQYPSVRPTASQNAGHNCSQKQKDNSHRGQLQHVCHFRASRVRSGRRSFLWRWAKGQARLSHVGQKLFSFQAIKLRNDSVDCAFVATLWRF